MAERTPYLKRIGRLRRRLSGEKIDGLLVTNLKNVRYLTGFKSSAAQLIVSERGATLLTDFRYIEAARKQVPFVEVIQPGKDAKKSFRDVLRKLGARRLGYESANVTCLRYAQLQDYVSGKRLRARADIVEKLRMIKDDEEIRTIRKAISLNEKGFRHIRRKLKAGVTELDIARELEIFFLKNGGDGLAFESIVAFGAGAAVPHHQTGRRKLRTRNMVLIDWGVRYDGYSSDLTRTLLSRSMTEKEKSIYEIVLEAQLTAIEKIRLGVRLASIDKAARDVITRYGHGEAFGHAFGHGIGLDIHEQPGVSAKSDVTCRKGMVITAEPGIYLPGWGGVRIEDDVLVTSNGHEVLSSLSKKPEPF